MYAIRSYYALLQSGSLRRGARRFDNPLPYNTNIEISSYGKLMREWPGFQGGESLYDHVIRYLPRDYELFARLDPGDQYPEAIRHAEAMFKEALEELQRTEGRILRKGSLAWSNLRSRIVSYNFV